MSDPSWPAPAQDGSVIPPDGLDQVIAQLGDLVGAVVEHDVETSHRFRESLLDQPPVELYLAGLHYCAAGMRWWAELGGEVARGLYGRQSDVIEALGDHEQFPAEFWSAVRSFEGKAYPPLWLRLYGSPAASILATVVTVGESLVHEVMRSVDRSPSAIAGGFADRAQIAVSEPKEE